MSEGATLGELKQMLSEMGGFDALNLIGGGPSALVARMNGAAVCVLNVPVHERIPGRARRVVGEVGDNGCSLKDQG